MLEVQTQERKGCVWMMTAVFSLGFAPYMLRRHDRQLPWQLTDDEMVLRNGTRIPWSQFTGASGTRVLFGDTYIGTRWVLRHAGGKVEVQTDKLQNPDAVMQFILARIPAQAPPTG
jgi:hypothetical protein